MRVSKRSSTCVSTKSRFGLDCANRFDLCDPFFLLAAGQFGAIVEKSAEPRGVGFAGLEYLQRIEPVQARNSSRTSLFMGVKRAGLSAPSSDSKYNSARLTPSQSKRADQRFNARGDRGERIRDSSGSSACASPVGHPAGLRFFRAIPGDRPRISR